MSLEFELTREQREKIASCIQSKIGNPYMSFDSYKYINSDSPNPLIKLGLLIGLSFVFIDLTDKQAIGILNSLNETMAQRNEEVVKILAEIEQELCQTMTKG